MVARGEINASSSKSFAKRVCSRLNLKSKHCFEISELIFVVTYGETCQESVERYNAPLIYQNT